MKAVLLVRNRWTRSEYVHPKVFTTERDLMDAIKKWDTTNTTVKPVYL